MGGLRALTGVGGASGEEHQFEFVGAGTVLIQSSEVLMDERDTGAAPQQAGVPGGGHRGDGGHGGQQGPQLPGSSAVCSAGWGCEQPSGNAAEPEYHAA